MKLAARIAITLVVMCALTGFARTEPSPCAGGATADAPLTVPSYAPGEVLFKFAAGVDGGRQGGILQRSGLGPVLKRMGPQGRVVLAETGGGLSVEDAAALLASYPEVEYAEPNYLRTPMYTPNDTGFSNQWGLNNTGQTIGGTPGTPGADIDAVRAWDIERGLSNPVTVAVLDSGINFFHPDLDGSIWTNGDEVADNGVDDDGNGYVDDAHGYNFAGISQTLFFYISGGMIYPTSRPFGTGAATRMYAQSITGTGYDITHAGICLTKVGNPTGTITVSLRTDLAGSDLGSFAISPDEVVESIDQVYKELSSPYHLGSGSSCYLVFRTDNQSATDYYSIYESQGSHNGNVYGEGQEWVYNGSAWTGNPNDDFYFKTNPNPYPRDDNGHGTYVSGIVAAECNNGQGISGVSHGARIMPLKVLDSGGVPTGALNTAEICEALYYAADNGARVASMSLGSYISSQAEQDAVNYAHGLGMVLCAAAGNDGANYAVYPACCENVIGVGATTNRDERASFSNYNAWVDVTAPGKDVYSTSVSGGYGFGSGTSAATPHAAGLAALVFSFRPGYSPAQVEEAMEANAEDLGNPGRDDYFGYGRIDAYRTLDCLSHDTCTVTASAGAGGSISPEGAVSVNYGSDQSFTITPDANYHVADVLVDGYSVGAVTSYDFTNVTAAHTIAASFAADTHTLVTHTVGSGTVGLNPAGGTYDYGTSVTLTAEPAVGWHFVGWSGDLGGTVNPETLAMTSDHDATATFAADTNVITASAEAGGSISPSGAVSVDYGADQSFTITPDANYHVADVLVDGYSVGAVTSYDFTNVTAAHTIAATFAIDTYTLSTGQVGSGSVAKNPGQSAYDYGTSVELTASPAVGYHFVEWTGDLTGTTSPGSLTMDANKTVIAHFAVNTYDITASADGSGAALGSGTYDHGSTVDLIANPAVHWHFVNWTEGASVVSTSAAYSFTATTARTLVAHFAIDTNVITASAGAGGFINPSGTVVLGYGADQSFTITPYFGYRVSEVTVDGVPQGAVTAYEFEGVTAGHTISATFEENSHTWYLAEGSTDWGFDCYVSVVNPNNSAVNVKLTYMTSTGPVTGPTVPMPARSQATVFPSTTLGAADFSTKVECLEGRLISVDRTMYWTGPGAPCSEAHCATGVTSPATIWYMPEGSSDWGFECFLLIQNPNTSAADCQVTWMIEGEDPVVSNKTVTANSRSTLNMADYIGAKDASIKVTSDAPVICERAMYRNDRREGHDSGGTSSAAADYYLAEGCSGFGFTTYILVQNPQGSPTDVTVTYQAASGPVAGPTFTMPANSRKTICVNDSTVIPGPDPSFSTRVHGSQPIIAERAMYWSGGPDYAQVCHDSIGLDKPYTNWYLADGQSGEGRETWTLVQNPNSSAVTVEITYMTPSGTGNITRTETIAAGSRRSFNMAEHSGISGRASIMVRCTTAGSKVMVERAMYWNSRGTGTDTIGGYSD